MEKNKQGLVSVIIPTYNREYVIERSINSVREQTYSNIEIIVVDDGSSDDTEKVVSQIPDERIRYLKNEKNCGVSHSRNIGIAAARGGYIAFQDSDDVWKKEKLEKQIHYMEDNGYDMVYCAFEREFVDGKCVYYPPKEIPLVEKQGWITKSLLKRNLISTQTMVIKKEVFAKIGYFNEGMSNLEDYELAVRISKEYQIGMIEEALVNLYTLQDGINQNYIESLINITYIYLSNKNLLIQYGMYDGIVAGVRKKAQEYGIEEIIEKMLHQSYAR